MRLKWLNSIYLLGLAEHQTLSRLRVVVPVTGLCWTLWGNVAWAAPADGEAVGGPPSRSLETTRKPLPGNVSRGGVGSSAEVPLAQVQKPAFNHLMGRFGFDESEGDEWMDDLVSVISLPPRSLEHRLVLSKCAPYLTGEKFLSGMPTTGFEVACVPLILRQEAVLRPRSVGGTAKTKVNPVGRSQKAKTLVTLNLKSGYALWQALEGVPFRQAFEALPVTNLEEAAQVLEWAEAGESKGKQATAPQGALPGPACGFAGAQAALAVRIESLLPDDGAWLMARRAYALAAPCLSPSDAGFERFHAQFGLLSLARGDEEAAHRALRASLGAYDTQEESRALFWLGLMEEKNRPQSHVNEAQWNENWHRLRRQYPLSIHAIIATHLLGKDPFLELVSEDKVLVDAGYPDSRLPWKRVHYAQLVFDLLVARGELEAAQKWSDFCQRFIEIKDEKKILYFAYLSHLSEHYRSSISWSHRYFVETGSSRVSPSLVKMLYPRPYADEILDHSGAVDPVLIFALIRQESAFNPSAKSAADAMGLMQLLPSTAHSLKKGSARHLLIPEENIELGVRYLKKLLVKFDGAVEKVLAAYNAGGRHIESWGKRYSDVRSLLFADLIPFKETRSYVSLIQRNAYWYGRLMTIQNDPMAKRLRSVSEKATYKSEVVSNLLNLAWSKNTNSNAQVALAESVRSGVAIWSPVAGTGENSVAQHLLPWIKSIPKVTDESAPVGRAAAWDSNGIDVPVAESLPATASP